MDPWFIQFLSVTPLLNYFADFYDEVIPQADLRTKKWMLMSSPDIPVSIVLAYLCTVIFLGPCVMRYLKIPWIKELLVVYNSLVLALNLWLGISFTWHIFRADYQFSCQKVGKLGKHENSIATLLWIFHCSKCIELIDTIFLVFKKKENQLTFLHLYHHSTIVCATWIGVKFAPGGSSAVIAMVNSWIHVFMYFYYEMMVLGVKSFRNYKKFVTIMQIVQFLATIVHCTTALKKDCGYPRWILTWLLLYMISFLVLFIQFYVQTYWKPKGNENTTAIKITKPDKSEIIEVKAKHSKRQTIISPVYSDDEEQESEVRAIFNGNSFMNGSSKEIDIYDENDLDRIGSDHYYNNGSRGIEIDYDDLISSDESSSESDKNDDEETNVLPESATVASSASCRKEGNDTLALH